MKFKDSLSYKAANNQDYFEDFKNWNVVFEVFEGRDDEEDNEDEDEVSEYKNFKFLIKNTKPGAKVKYIFAEWHEYGEQDFCDYEMDSFLRKFSNKKGLKRYADFNLCDDDGDHDGDDNLYLKRIIYEECGRLKVKNPFSRSKFKKKLNVVRLP